MTTQKKKVSSYIDDPVFNALTAFCKGKKLTVSKGLDLILLEFFGLEVSAETTDLIMQRFADIEARLAALEKPKTPNVTVQVPDEPVDSPDEALPILDAIARQNTISVGK